MQESYENVAVLKKANVYFGGDCISHTVVFSDGTKKTLGVILPTEHPLEFKTSSPERMEIVGGECLVKIANDEVEETYTEGQSFFVAGNSKFEIKALDPVHYVCHFEN